MILSGVVQAYDAETGMATIEQRTNFAVGDVVDFQPPIMAGLNRLS